MGDQNFVDELLTCFGQEGRGGRHRIEWPCALSCITDHLIIRRERKPVSDSIVHFLLWRNHETGRQKIAKFDKNITKRGFVPETTTKKGKDYPIGPILLSFFLSSRSSGLQLAEAWRKLIIIQARRSIFNMRISLLLLEKKKKALRGYHDLLLTMVLLRGSADMEKDEARERDKKNNTRQQKKMVLRRQ
ncbi:hypothetical protein YC2023_089968 [Brassica napus]